MSVSVAASSLLAQANRSRGWGVVGTLLIGCCVLLGQRAFARESSEPAPPAVLSGVAFRDQSGAPFHVERLAGSSLLLNFVFTRCPSVCPTQTRELVRLRKALPATLRSRVAFATISLDPSYDSAANLLHFAKENGADWPFLAASPSATQELLGQLSGAASSPSLPEVEPDSGALPSGHGTALYLFDRHGRLMQRYVGAPIDERRLLTDLARVDRVSQAPAQNQPVASRDREASP